MNLSGYNESHTVTLRNSDESVLALWEKIFNNMFGNKALDGMNGCRVLRYLY